jgi:predicted Zn-dependent protease with MMP-like domain
VQPVSPASSRATSPTPSTELPPELAARFDNVVVVVEDEHDDDPDLLGLYEGIALTEREHYAGAAGPDQPLPASRCACWRRTSTTS